MKEAGKRDGPKLSIHLKGIEETNCRWDPRLEGVAEEKTWSAAEEVVGQMVESRVFQ
jgi:hypothetical protein